MYFGLKQKTTNGKLKFNISFIKELWNLELMCEKSKIENQIRQIPKAQTQIWRRMVSEILNGFEFD
jgi:hypothetical protein